MPVDAIIYVESWSTGGIESFLKNLLRHFSSRDVRVTLFAVWGTFDRDANELDALGVRYFSVFGSEDPGIAKRTIEGPREFERVLKRHHFDVAHINTMNGMGLRYCAIARRLGVPQVIAHSHNSNVGEGMRALKIILHGLGRALYGGAPSVRLSCGEEAGRFLYGGRQFTVLKNGIDTNRFAFDEETRVCTRRRLGLKSDAILVGTIGRVVQQKNPLFCVRVFRELLASDSRARLLMVGSGDLDSDVNRLISDLRIDEFVIRIPATADVAEYYCALDAFLLPSRFEGVPFASIEAQCAGLPVLASAEVPREAAITDLYHWLPLTEPLEGWAERLSELLKGGRNVNRRSYASKVASAGYDALITAKSVASFYDISTAALA